MIDKKSDFTVDLTARKVTHQSGAAATFNEYVNVDDWRASDVVIPHNRDLYPGPETELARLTKISNGSHSHSMRRSDRMPKL